MSSTVLYSSLPSPSSSFSSLMPSPQPEGLDFDVYSRTRDISSIAASSPSLSPPEPVENFRIIIARPLRELFSHVCHLKLPPLELLARSIYVFIKSVINWHFCDLIFLEKDDIFYCATGTKYRDKESLEQNKPYMLENAVVYEVPNTGAVSPHRFRDFKKFTPQTLKEYFNKVHSIQIYDTMSGNDFQHIFRSSKLNRLDA